LGDFAGGGQVIRADAPLVLIQNRLAGVLKNNVLERVIFGDFLDDFGIKIVFGIFGLPIAKRVAVRVI